MKAESIVVGIYGRVSTMDGETSNQLNQLRAFCAKQGWRVESEYVDHAVSGAKSGATRPEFARMMQDASKRKFDVLLFWSLDRLSREGVAQTLDYLNRLGAWGVGFRSYSEPYLDSLGVFKDAVLAILACIAKQERIRISERTKAGLERVKRAGVRLGRPALQKQVIERIRQLRATGKSVRETAKAFDVSVGVVSKHARHNQSSSLTFRGEVARAELL